MSKRTERREAERTARKLAYKLSRQQPPAAAQIPLAAAQPSPVAVKIPPAEAQFAAPPLAAPSTPQPDLITQAHAFFERPATTEAQLQANRANAQHSHGPTSPEGKAISSRNNTRHGLTAEPDAQNFQVLPTEDQTVFNRNLAAFQSEWKPETATEHDLVSRLAMHQWLRRRAVRLQEALFSPETGEITDTKKFDLYRRYETSHERGFNKAFADLLRLRAFQLRQQNGFESQRRKNIEHEFKMQRLKNQDDSKQSTKIARETNPGDKLIQKQAA